MLSRHSVLVDLGKHESPYGLSQASWQYGKKLIQKSEAELEWNFLVPANYQHEFGAHTEVFSYKRKYFPSLCKGYTLWHSLCQDSAYMPSSKSKYVLTIHDLHFLTEKEQAKSKKSRKRLQRKIDRADGLVFASNYVQQEALKELDIKNIPQYVVYQGAQEPLASSPLTECPSYIPEGDFLLAFGEATPKNNFHVLLELLPKLPATINLVIACSYKSDYTSHLQSKVEELGMNKRILLLIGVKEEVKDYLYRNCKAFCFPAVYDGLGISIVEAMHYGKPIFTSTKASLPEIGGDHVFYWENFEPGYMAAAYQQGLIKFNRDPQAAVVAMRQYANNFSWQKNVTEYISIYKNILQL